jgi:hypothetical protein
MTMSNSENNNNNADDVRALASLDASTTECSDGTICENSAPCTPHPLKEGSYMCDCISANGGAIDSAVKFAGIYCEHQATSYCQRGSDESAHAFCTNDGECRLMVGKNEEHAGCKCPRGYTGSYCQFVQGSMPSDWTLDNYMHPALVNAYSTNEAGANPLTGILIGAGVGLAVIAGILVMYLYCGFQDLKAKLQRSQKELDTANGDDAGAVLGGRRESAVSPRGITSEFIGGKSVYKKKTSTSTGGFGAPGVLEADGGVLTDAMAEHHEQIPSVGDVEGGKESTSMEEVDLDDLPSSLQGNGGAGELA